MATKDGRSQIWYADGNGNVEGYTETVDDIIETIINTYNVHFGTDIQLWTPETKTLQVGDTVPNWKAYEKINGFWGKFAVGTNQHNTSNFICTIEGHSALFQTKNNQMPIVSEEGRITGFGPTIQDMAEWCLSKIKAEYDITIIFIHSELVFWNVGDEIEDWNSYIKISY